MPRIRTISPEVVDAATQALKGMPENKVQFRLLAIVKSAEKGVQSVSDFFSIHYNTLGRWIKRFEEGGVDALKDKPKGHFSSKLTQEHLCMIEHWLETQANIHGACTHWTLEKLQHHILEVWTIRIAIGPLWGHLRRLGYSHKSVRPKHIKRPEQEVVETFKKVPTSWCKVF